MNEGIREGWIEYPYFPDQLPQFPVPKPMFGVRGFIFSWEQLGRVSVGDLDDLSRTGDMSRISKILHRDPNPRPRKV